MSVDWLPDPLQLPETYGQVAEPDAWDLLDGAVVGSALWGAAMALVSLLLAAVAAALLIRRWTR